MPNQVKQIFENSKEFSRTFKALVEKFPDCDRCSPGVTPQCFFKGRDSLFMELFPGTSLISVFINYALKQDWGWRRLSGLEH